MKFAKICIILLFFIISIGCVSATEEINNDTISNDNTIELDESTLDDARLQSTQNDEIIGNEINDTFTDLNNEISAATDTINIEHNYKFNNETDNSSVLILRDNLTINGNNYILDGNNQASILHISGKNITINNLIFANGYFKLGNELGVNGGGAIMLNVSSSLTLNNVTFINNGAKYNAGDILVYGAQLKCVDCKFTDSNAVRGNSILSVSSSLNIENCTFTSKHVNKWATVYISGGIALINNSLFTDISSQYDPAIYAENANEIIINNSKFKNLRANITAGAVGLKTSEHIMIENCSFINTHSAKNAGAIFVDTQGEGVDYIAEIILKNLTFTNTSSSFGGAYLQLGGDLTLKDSIFTNCSSDFDGGAVYLSKVDAKIDNSKFNSNKAAPKDNYPTSGGAIYFDYGPLNITNSEFNNNEAPLGSAMLMYDSEYHLDNITLNNNGNAIYSYFDDDSSTIGKIYGNDIISDDDLNNTFYPNLVIGEGMSLNLTTNIIDLTILPTKFDLREIGWITPIEDQGNMGSCWTFGATAALESALIKNTGIAYSFSENNMQDTMIIFSRYGGIQTESGTGTISAAYLLNWFGVIPQEYDTYDELGKISPLIHTNQTIHLQDFVLIQNNISNPGDPILKQAILKYGVLDILFDGSQDCNATLGTFYTPNATVPNHAVGLVGWDDTFSRYNFPNTPEGDGAWIIKNSWGEEWGDGGYGYLSYYDASLSAISSPQAQAVGFIIENTLPYNKNYQYDFEGLNDFMTYDVTDELYGSTITNVNNFVSEDDDLIAAVGTYFNNTGLEYTVDIAVNDVIVYTQNIIAPYRGYHTIKLNSYIPIKKGDKFSIYVTSTALGMSCPVRVYYEEGVSLTNYNGTWQDLYQTYGGVACIKAYTLKDDTVITENKDIAVDYTGGSYFSVKVVSADGHAIAGASVKFSINGKTSTVKSDSNGIAKIKIIDVPKKYTMTTTYNGKSYKNTVTVKQVLTTSKVTVKKTAKKFTLQAKLKINGKLVKGKKISFKFNGKTYKATTNAKGIAKVTIKKNVIKKLKKGKTYAVKVTYLKDTVKSSVKVKK